MGFLDRLKDKSRGILTAARPQDGVAPVDEAELRRRLGAIEGRGTSTIEEDDGTVVVAWAAKVASAGAGGAGYEHLYRAVRIELDAAEHEATGLCLKTTTEAELGWTGSFSGSTSWERGQHVGTETLHVLAWLGPHHTEGGADERGYRFSWSQLRDPVIDAVTGAGWTYKPKRF
jgi:hypothetical protein